MRTSTLNRAGAIISCTPSWRLGREHELDSVEATLALAEAELRRPPDRDLRASQNCKREKPDLHVFIGLSGPDLVQLRPVSSYRRQAPTSWQASNISMQSKLTGQKEPTFRKFSGKTGLETSFARLRPPPSFRPPSDLIELFARFPAPSFSVRE